MKIAGRWGNIAVIEWEDNGKVSYSISKGYRNKKTKDWENKYLSVYPSEASFFYEAAKLIQEKTNGIKA